jgi:hypothetical protein
MADITYRTDGAWGPGKGSDVDATEIDESFYSLHVRVLAVETNPPAAVSIDHFTITGTLLRVYLTDGSIHGPFVLPVAQWRWTGPFIGLTHYLVGDIIEDDGSLYFVRVDHTAGAVFDPGLFTTDGFVYQLILQRPGQPYDIGLFYNDTIPGGEEIIAMHVAARELTIPANFLAAQAYLRVATTTSTIMLPIFQNQDVIGFITFSPGIDTDALGGQFGTFSMTTPDAAVVLAIRDLLAISLPYDDDATASGLVVTIPVSVASI